MTRGLMQKNQANNREALYEVQIYTTLFNKKIMGYKKIICVPLSVVYENHMGVTLRGVYYNRPPAKLPEWGTP